MLVIVRVIDRDRYAMPNTALEELYYGTTMIHAVRGDGPGRLGGVPVGRTWAATRC